MVVIVWLLNVYLAFQLLRNRDINKVIDLSSIFTKKQYYQPLLINICLVSIQQFTGNISLMDKLQCAYGEQLPLSEMIPTITGFQVLAYCYRSLSFIIHYYSSIKYIILVYFVGR